MKTADAARGKWRGILLSLGIDQKFLTGKHGPCPMCEGRDRFRWDNFGGNGGWICNQCGSGDGFKLAMALKGWDFQACAKAVDDVVGNVTETDKAPTRDKDRERDNMRRLYVESSPIRPDDPAGRYLKSRVALPASLPACLRFGQYVPAPGGATYPALLAVVSSVDGAAINMHRTFLGPKGKAEIATPRAMMPGEHPEGSAVRLFPVIGEKLGIAEGIETAFGAAARFSMPVWSALNSTALAKWTPPPTVTEVVIFGDNDPKFGGQKAAYALAHRLAIKGITVRVEIPPVMGKDWADADCA